MSIKTERGTIYTLGKGNVGGILLHVKQNTAPDGRAYLKKLGFSVYNEDITYWLQAPQGTTLEDISSEKMLLSIPQSIYKEPYKITFISQGRMGVWSARELWKEIQEHGFHGEQLF